MEGSSSNPLSAKPVLRARFQWSFSGEYFFRRITSARSTYASMAKETNTKILEWHDEEPYAVEGLLISLYTAQYPLSLIRCPKPKSTFENHIKLFQIADKRQAPTLRTQAVNKLAFSIKRCTTQEDLSSKTEQLRATELPIPKKIAESVARAIIDSSEKSSFIDALWPEGSLERGAIRHLFVHLREQQDSIRGAARTAEKMSKSLKPGKYFSVTDRNKIAELGAFCDLIAS